MSCEKNKWECPCDKCRAFRSAWRRGYRAKRVEEGRCSYCGQKGLHTGKMCGRCAHKHCNLSRKHIGLPELSYKKYMEIALFRTAKALKELEAGKSYEEVSKKYRLKTASLHQAVSRSKKRAVEK